MGGPVALARDSEDMTQPLFSFLVGLCDFVSFHSGGYSSYAAKVPGVIVAPACWHFMHTTPRGHTSWGNISSSLATRPSQRRGWKTSAAAVVVRPVKLEGSQVNLEDRLGISPLSSSSLLR